VRSSKYIVSIWNGGTIIRNEERRVYILLAATDNGKQQIYITLGCVPSMI
jgi:hypothetical protein